MHLNTVAAARAWLGFLFAIGWTAPACQTSTQQSSEKNKSADKPSKARPRDIARQSGGAQKHSAQIKSARSFFALMRAGRFEKAVQRFSPRMAAAMNAEKLKKTWQSIEGSMGKAKRISETQTAVRGALVAVTLRTEFAQGAINIRVVINQKDAVAGLFFRPAPSKAPYEKPAYVDKKQFREKQITVGKGKWELPATLSLPNQDGESCGVVLVHGSGPHDRDETIYANKPFRDLAWGLASRGIAVLRYDKRTQVHRAALMKQAEAVTIKEETVDDAVAAAAALRAQLKVHPDCIFIAGHSLGGYVAPLIAARDSRLAGLILLAANTRPLEVLVWTQMNYIFGLDGELSAEEKAKLKKLKAQLDLLKNPAALESKSKKELPLGLSAAYWKALLAYDPVKQAQTLSLPMLILQGQRDYQVTMKDWAGWKKGLQKKKNVVLKSYPQLNHLFMPGTGKSTPSEYKKPAHVAKEVIADIGAFVKSHAPSTLARPRPPTSSPHSHTRSRARARTRTAR
jgi:hypothetical protein